MFKNNKIIITFTVIVLLLIALTFSSNWAVNNNENFKKCELNKINSVDALLVLGAKVEESGKMSQIFKDRVDTAMSAYQDNFSQKILVSGDHGRSDYDEVNAAKDYLLENGVEAKDIFLDHAGFDTYDSLYRAKHVFEVDNVAVVTQDFHLPRAIYIADQLGLEACALSADRQFYLGEADRKRREVLANVKAYLEILFNIKPKFLGEKIPITGDGQSSWD